MIDKAFTLIELLIVISIIGILSGVLMTVIDPRHQRKMAWNGLAENNLASFAGAIESYHSAEGDYPTTDEFNNPNSRFRSYYIRTGFSEPEGAVYEYESDGQTYVALVDLQDATEGCYKISSLSDAVEMCPESDCTTSNTDCTN